MLYSLSLQQTAGILEQEGLTFKFTYLRFSKAVLVQFLPANTPEILKAPSSMSFVPVDPSGLKVYVSSFLNNQYPLHIAHTYNFSWRKMLMDSAMAKRETLPYIMAL